MPYKDPKQAIAILLDKKRREGQAAAEAFSRKHRADFKKNNRRTKPYRGRSK